MDDPTPSRKQLPSASLQTRTRAFCSQRAAEDAFACLPAITVPQGYGGTCLELLYRAQKGIQSAETQEDSESGTFSSMRATAKRLTVLCNAFECLIHGQELHLLHWIELKRAQDTFALAGRYYAFKAKEAEQAMRISEEALSILPIHPQKEQASGNGEPSVIHLSQWGAREQEEKARQDRNTVYARQVELHRNLLSTAEELEKLGSAVRPLSLQANQEFSTGNSPSARQGRTSETSTGKMRAVLLEPLLDEYFFRLKDLPNRFAAHPGTFVHGLGSIYTVMLNDPQERYTENIPEMESLCEVFTHLLQGTSLSPDEHVVLAHAPAFLSHLSDVFDANLDDFEYRRKMQQSMATMLCLFSTALEPLCGWSGLVASAANQNEPQRFKTV